MGPIDHARTAESASLGSEGVGLEENEAGCEVELTQASICVPSEPLSGYL